ncbi:MAG: ComEC/Rec2 family competence protein [Elusimicrobiota bacterium]
MKTESFVISIIKWGCWAFVAGVGIANILGPQEYEFMVRMWVFSGVFFILSGYLYFASRNLVKYTMIPAVVVFGLAAYQWQFDTSNPDHISNFIDADRWDTSIVRGVVTRDPDVRDWVTHVVIKPTHVVANPEGAPKPKKLEGKVGSLIVFVSKEIESDTSYYNEMEYGDEVEVTGAITQPMPLTNPHGFDYAEYLVNQGVYASMYVGEAKNISFKGKADLGYFNRVKKFAYRIKDRMILGLKKTVPPPASAFIGGITVGARGGVPDVQQFDFQATGVAHVLALSGLHVGFIAIMLIMFFNNFFKSPLLFYKVPSKLFGKEIDLTPYSLKLIPPFVIGALFLFTIITGARPATVRASMMYSIMIVFNLWLGLNLQKAGSITIPMAAAVMLGMNSFLIYDASFALSFTAVWSIVYLSGPLRNIFSRLIVGWGQMVFFIFFASSVTLMIVAPWVYTNSDFLIFYTVALSLMSLGAYLLEKKYPLDGFEFEGWWPYVAGFFCVQLSIQIGMMWPLSGVYFNRFPVAGLLANFIAIPLVGIIVPLGLLGELFTFVPVIGDKIGLLIGGTNTILSNFFLWFARLFRTYFPYPIHSAPPAKWLVIYYIMVLIFAFNRKIRRLLVKSLKISKKQAVWAVVILLTVIFSSGYWAEELVKGTPKKDEEILITYLDVDYGNCILIQTPTGKNFLIDGGARGGERYWSMGGFGSGESVIIPNLSGYNISKLDKVILSNPLPENVGGLIYVMEYFNVDEFWDTLDPENFPRDISYTEFLQNIKDVRMMVKSDQPLPVGTYLNYYDLINKDLAPAGSIEQMRQGKEIHTKKLVPRHKIYRGVVIYEDTYNGKDIRLEALNPPEERITKTGDNLQNNSAVLKLTYGERSFLFASDIQREGEQILIDELGADVLNADILTVPDHGNTTASSGRFLEMVDPVFAVAQYGYLKDRSFYDSELERTLMNYEKRNIKVFRTDTQGAVEVRSDGKVVDITSVLGG